MVSEKFFVVCLWGSGQFFREAVAAAGDSGVRHIQAPCGAVDRQVVPAALAADLDGAHDVVTGRGRHRERHGHQEQNQEPSHVILHLSSAAEIRCSAGLIGLRLPPARGISRKRRHAN